MKFRHFFQSLALDFAHGHVFLKVENVEPGSLWVFSEGFWGQAKAHAFFCPVQEHEDPAILSRYLLDAKNTLPTIVEESALLVVWDRTPTLARIGIGAVTSPQWKPGWSDDPPDWLDFRDPGPPKTQWERLTFLDVL